MTNFLDLLKTKTGNNSCSVQQLIKDIRLIYIDRKKIDYCLSYKQLLEIQFKLMTGKYELSPLHAKSLPMSLISEYVSNKTLHCPDFRIVDSSLVVYPNDDDCLVLMGLSLMLLRKTVGNLNDGILSMDDYLFNEINFVCELKPGKILYKIDLEKSSVNIHRSIILNKIKGLVDDEHILQLISNYISLPIIDDKTKEDISHHIRKESLPPAGDISTVLFDLGLQEVFDKEIVKKFPGINYKRYCYEVYLTLSKEDIFDFNEKIAMEFLREVGLTGTVDSVTPSDGLWLKTDFDTDLLIVMGINGEVIVTPSDKFLW